jgi:hypothetical protein
MCLDSLGIDETNGLINWAASGCPSMHEVLIKRVEEGWRKAKQWREIAE